MRNIQPDKPDRAEMSLLPGWLRLCIVAFVFICAAPLSAFAQGSIFGAVQNADLSTPANGEILFFGFLDDTDEEIRIDLSTGAGYDAGNWFDDFQNYLTEAPGNPYDYYFFNTTNNEGAALGKAIPNNSFQQEDITLAPVSWPAQPAGLAAAAVSGSSVVVSWNAAPGATYHIYRRLAVSSGSFFRLDDPTGSLANAGVADSFFVDNTVDGVSSYDYVIIAEDALGNYSPHSAVVTVNSALTVGPSIAAITPNSGVEAGGETVTISGTYFDMAGVTAIVGTSLNSITVVSPFEITGQTQASTAGPVNVSLTNIASGMVSNTLVGGFTYVVDAPPVLALIGPQVTPENVNLNFSVSATDDAGIPTITTSALPGSATFTPDGLGGGTFDWTPDFTESGLYSVTFYATDGGAQSDSEVVAITVSEAGNQLPALAAIGPQVTNENVNLNFAISSTDAESVPLASTSPLPTGATFTPDGSGGGTFDWTPSFLQSGVYNVTFYSTDDSSAVDSEVVALTVTEVGNQLPVLAAIGPQSVNENANLNLILSATDIESVPVITSTPLPTGATFDGTTFDWTPGFVDAGNYSVTFYATDDSAAVDSEVVSITVNEIGNQLPVLAAIGAQVATEGVNLNFLTSATDAESVPVITSSALPVGATFDGTTFDWTPAFTDAGAYSVTFYATDDSAAVDSEVVAITVSDAGNQAPILAAIGAQVTDENLNLNFSVSSTDAESTPTASAVNLPLGATFTPDTLGGGVFDWTPDFVQAGAHQVTFITTDASLAADSEVVTITVNEVGNQTPALAAIGAQIIAEGAPLNVAVSSSDPESTPIITTSALPVGALFTPDSLGGGAFDWTPDFLQSGAYSVTFYATDDSAAVDSEVVSITVTESGNQAPALAAIGPQVVVENSPLNFVVTSSDAESIPVVTTSALPTGATFTPDALGGGVFDWTPSFTDGGVYSVTFYTTDDSAAVDSEVVAITVTESGNQTPLLAAIGPQLTTENVNLNFAVSATDAESIPTVTTSTLPAGATFTPDTLGGGVFDWTPTVIQGGLYSVTFYATDGDLAVDSEIVAITVNDLGNQAPVLDSIGPKFTLEGAILSFAVSASDSESVPTLTSSALPLGATFADSGDGTGVFDWVPNFTDVGSYNVTFYATDDSLAVDSETVTITVSEAGNQGPIISGVADTSIAEGNILQYVITAVDPDGVTPPSISISTAMSNTTFVDSGNGTAVFTYTPSFFDGGVDSLIIFATDGAVPPVTTQLAVQITTLEVNQAPTVDSLGPFGVLVGGLLEFNVVARDSTDQDTTHNVVLSVINPPLNSTFVDSLNSTGHFTFSPQTGQEGVDTVRFLAVDQGAPQLSATLEVIISVVADNLEPTIAEVAPQSVLEGNTLTVVVSASDPDGDSLILSAREAPANSVFVDSGNGVGVFTFTPSFTQGGSQGASLLHSVTFIAFDGIDDARELAYIQVYDAGNQAPLFDTAADTSVIEGDSLLHVVFASDPDGTVPTLTADSLPLNASFIDNGDGTGTILFNPIFIQAGTYTVFINADDGAFITTTSLVLVVVDAGNQPPTLPFDSLEIVLKEGDLYNTTVGALDPDSTIPFIRATNLPFDATFSDNGNGTGTLNWQTQQLQTGTYLIVIYADDQFDPLIYDSALVSIVVEDVNLPPILLPDPVFGQLQEVNEGQTLTYRVKATDADSTVAILTIDTAGGFIENLTFVDSGNGVGLMTFSPDFTQGAPNTGQQYVVTFIATDAVDDTLTHRINSKQFTVFDVNLAPILTTPASPIALLEGDSVLFTVQATDPDQPVSQFFPVVTAENLPANATFTSVGGTTHTMEFRFAPDFTQSGSYPVTFIADDGDLTDTVIVQIDVTEAGNQIPVWLTVLDDTTFVVAGNLTDIYLTSFDADADSVVITNNFSPQGASLLDSGNGAGFFRYDPDPTDVGNAFPVEFYVTDINSAVDTIRTVFQVQAFLRGDANSDTRVDLTDIVFLVDYIFREGRDPVSRDAADVNFDQSLSINDISYLTNYLFRSGPPPPNGSPE